MVKIDAGYQQRIFDVDLRCFEKLISTTKYYGYDFDDIDRVQCEKTTFNNGDATIRFQIQMKDGKFIATCFDLPHKD